MHDVAGYAPGDGKKKHPEVNDNLRLNRALVAGYCLTVEPGFYFNPFLIDELMADDNPLQKFVNALL